MQPQLREVPFMAKPASPDDVSIVFEQTPHCQGSFNESKARDDVIARIRDLGRSFYGQYTVLVGDSVGFAQTQFTWKPHDSKQKGLGFILGESTDGSSSFMARCFSLKPPAYVDIEEMWHLLNDRRMSAQPKLIPVPEVRKEEAMSTPAGDNPLALGLAKHELHQKRLNEATAEREALLIEIPKLEAQAASQPTIKQRVAERLREYGLEP